MGEKRGNSGGNSGDIIQIFGGFLSSAVLAFRNSDHGRFPSQPTSQTVRSSWSTCPDRLEKRILRQPVVSLKILLWHDLKVRSTIIVIAEKRD